MRLCEIGIPLKPQGFVQMAEGLLFGDQLNVIPASICHQFANFSGSKRATCGPDQWIRLAGERVLHIKGVHVHLKESFRANLPLDVVDRRHGPAADIV